MRSEVTDTVRLAGPIVVTQVASISMGVVDTLMVSRGLGSGALAAVALGNAVFFACMVFGMGVMNAVSPMVSQAYGAQNHPEVGRAYRQGLWLGLFIGLPLFVAIRLAPSFLLWIGQDPPTVELAGGYIHAISWGVFPFLWFIGTRCFVEGVSRPRPATVIALIGIPVNVILNYGFMFGHFGLPELGLVGTGVASAIAYWVNFTALVLFCLNDARLRGLADFLHIRKPDFTYMRALAKLGAPIGVSQGVEASLFMVTLLLMGYISTQALAAHQIAIQVAAFAFMVPVGIGVATAVRVGQAVGRRDGPGVPRAGFAGILIAVVFMSMSAIFLWLFPDSIVRLFMNPELAENREVAGIAIVLLGIAAVFQIVDGAQVAAIGALRGVKDTFVPMLICIVTYWGAGLGLGYVLAFKVGLGSTGLWWGLVSGLGTAAVSLTVRFVRVSKRHAQGVEMLRLHDQVDAAHANSRQ